MRGAFAIVATGIIIVFVIAAASFFVNSRSAVFADEEAQAKTVEVVIPTAAATRRSNWYEPQDVRINAGDTVVWTNRDAIPHTATADNKSSDTGILESGETSKAITFVKAGEYLYHCVPHPWMKGKVVVVEGGDDVPTQTPKPDSTPDLGPTPSPDDETEGRGTRLPYPIGELIIAGIVIGIILILGFGFAFIMSAGTRPRK